MSYRIGPKQFKKSKFDPYIYNIMEYLQDGLTVKTIAEKLDNYFDEPVDESALYAFIQSRGLKYSKERKFRVPNCNTCENCHFVIGLNNEEIRMCYSTRLIRSGVKTSPSWCHKRERQAG